MQTLHTQQRCVPPPSDCSDHVGGRADHASPSGTPERRRAPAGLGAGDVADRTGLTAETGGQRAPSPAGFPESARHACREWMSVRLGGNSAEAGFPWDITAELRDRAARADTQVARFRPLSHGDTEPTCTRERGAAIEVAADAGLPGLRPDGSAPCSASTVRPAHAARHNSLGLAPADFERSLARGLAPLLARGASERPRCVESGTDVLGLRSGHVVLALACRAHLPSDRLASDRDTLRRASDRTSVVDLRASDFRQPHGSRQTVPEAQNDLLARDAERVTDAAFTRARVACPARKEAPDRLAEAVRPLLSARAAGVADRREPGPQARQVGPLHEAESMPVPLGGAPLRTRLIDEATPAAALSGRGFRFWHRFEPVAEATVDRSLLPARTAHLISPASRAEARFPRPESRGSRSSR